MNTITIPTTLMCQGCVESLRAIMDTATTVKEWGVDLSSPEKTLTASGDNLTQADVIALLQQAGYDTLQQPPSTTLPPING